MWKYVSANLEKATEMQKKHTDARRQEATFDVGTLVLLSTKNLNIKGRTSKKLY